MSNLNGQKQITIQYISQGKTTKEHLDNIENVCKSGGNWIQLRLKNVSHLEYLKAARKARIICDTYGATLIINDNIGVAGESQADGVHLGLGDASPIEARKQLGENAIVGGTANTLEDCQQRAEEGVDYIGLGPFRFTTTKNKLSPTLGLEGYSKIISALANQDVHIPIVGIGGIQVEDVSELMTTGLTGIAVSGLLSNKSSNDIALRIKEIKENRIKEVIDKNGI